MYSSQKLFTLGALCLVFAFVLALINVLVSDRMNYAAALTDGFSDYRMIARSIKYGLLLVVFTFTTFFLYEMMNELRIHPIQYLFVGAALSVFYLLLLSLAEQIGFIPAYLIAAVACISLITWYLQFMVKAKGAILLIGGLLTAGYAVMLVLLRLPVYSLLLGSVLVFIALFAVMFITRHIDWYALSAKSKHEEA